MSHVRTNNVKIDYKKRYEANYANVVYTKGFDKKRLPIEPGIHKIEYVYVWCDDTVAVFKVNFKSFKQFCEILLIFCRK